MQNANAKCSRFGGGGGGGGGGGVFHQCEEYTCVLNKN